MRVRMLKTAPIAGDMVAKGTLINTSSTDGEAAIANGDAKAEPDPDDRAETPQADPPSPAVPAPQAARASRSAPTITEG